MTLSVATVWEVRTSGSDTLNSGGFVAGASGTDYSQQNAAQYNATDLAVDAVSNVKVTSSTHSFVAADVGNILRVTAGAGWTAGPYQILSVSGGAATLDASPAVTSTTGGSYCVGGAFASPGQAGAFHVGGNVVYVKSGTYSITSASTNVAGGCPSLTLGVTANQTRIVGYGTSRNDNGTKPLLQASGIATFTVVTLGAACRADNLAIDCASLASGRGIAQTTGQSMAVRCKVSNASNNGIRSTSSSAAILCEVTGCSSVGIQGGLDFYCWSHDNTSNGFDISGFGGVAVGCVSSGNTGIGFNGAAQNGQVINCLAYGNTTVGFNISVGATQGALVNCVAVNNGTFGFGFSATCNGVWLYNCAGFNNSSGDVQSNLTAGNNVGFLTLTGGPFANAAGNDFSLNTTAGAGASLRAAGVPGLSAGSYGLPGLSTNSYPDVGVAQHADPGGGKILQSSIIEGIASL